MKTCRKCNEAKPDDLFSVDRREVDGRRRVCLSCAREYNKAYREQREDNPRLTRLSVLLREEPVKEYEVAAMSHREIAKEMGISPQAVFQIEKKALQKLRLAAEYLRESRYP